MKGLLKRGDACESTVCVDETPLSPLLGGASQRYTPIPVQDLWSYVAQRKMSTGDGFKEEYEVG